jgi:diguanylate cyclase (GGDEF)-like protein
VGDQVLAAVARLLREGTRSTGLLARVGDEESMVVLRDIPPGRAAEVCERLRQAGRSRDWQAIAPALQVTLSVGLAVAPPHDEMEPTARADAALYRAKALGRDRVIVD